MDKTMTLEELRNCVRGIIAGDPKAGWFKTEDLLAALEAAINAREAQAVDAAHTRYLIEYRDPCLRQTTGYVMDIRRDNDYLVVMTKDPNRAIKFASKREAQDILDNTGFIHAMGNDHHLVVEGHIWYGDPDLYTAPPAQPKVEVTDAMVQRFLGWRLPDTFAPGWCISFNREAMAQMGNGSHWPIGTDLLNDPEARAMLEYVLSQEPQS